MNLLLVDLETTGLDPETNGIISISAKLFNSNREVINSFNQTCNPQDAEINLGALKVNRFTISAINNFRNEKDILRSLCDWLLGLSIDGELVIGGHNVGFDTNFLKVRLRKYGIVGFDQAASHRVLDTASLGRFLFLVGLLPTNKVSLKDLVLALNIEYDATKHHDSEYDVDLAAKVLFKMIDLTKGSIYGKNP